MAYAHFHELTEWTPSVPLLDTDGSPLYETDYRALLLSIITDDNIPMLHRYISSYSKDYLLAPGETNTLDPFWNAAASGSTESLNILFDYYRDEPSPVVLLEKRRFSLVTTAASHGQLETVRWLLEHESLLESLHIPNADDGSILLAAAGSLSVLGLRIPHPCDDLGAWLRVRVSRGEELIKFLLKRGASPCTTGLAPQPPSEDGKGLVAWSSFVLCSGVDLQSPEQPVDTVLSQAASRAGYGVIKQLIDAGADVHAKHRHLDQHLFEFNDIHRDSTALHVGSLYWNDAGIQALLDHHDTGNASYSVREMVCSLDVNGRTPLHWAAKGSRLIGCLLPDEEVNSRLVGTFKALLTGSSDMVNHKDKEGSTPLHYFIQLHANCGETKHFENALRLLLEAGADPNIKDIEGKSALHLLALWSVDSDPLSPSILDLLLAHGAGINDVDKEGNTAFHIMAKNLRQIEAAKTLLGAGADPRAENAKGNTPFHELMQSGMLRFRARDLVRRLEDEMVTVDDRIKAQDDMFNALIDAAWDGLMDQPNAAGRTPRQLRFEAREKWWDIEEKRKGMFTRGRARRVVKS
ncbi:ankyrin repeat-containing domain protein [Penicillium herquei]|nr:ankyrin repeat-containing domain protein [Penicillium herquei]